MILSQCIYWPDQFTVGLRQ